MILYFRRLFFCSVTESKLHGQSPKYMPRQDLTPALDILTDILPKLSNLISFVYRVNNFSPPPTFVTSLTKNPCLNSLELSTSFLTRKADPTLFSTFSSLRLRQLTINPPEQATLYSAPEDILSFVLESVSNLILACRSTLDTLELPGDYCPLSTLASTSTPAPTFPALRKFVLKGYPPLHANKYPIWKVLSSMPRLSVLEISCRLRVVGASPHRYTLMPEDTEPPPGSSYLFPSELDTLTISNPSLKDHIFKRLPHSLKFLVLDFIPDWENMLSSGDALAYHRPGELAKMLKGVENEWRRKMSGLRGNSLHVKGFSNVQHLCIKMGWCVTPELLGLVCRLFSGLQTLVFEGIRYVNRGEEPESDMVCYAFLLLG
jgi:hypothetical protein